MKSPASRESRRISCFVRPFPSGRQYTQLSSGLHTRQVIFHVGSVAAVQNRSYRPQSRLIIRPIIISCSGSNAKGVISTLELSRMLWRSTICLLSAWQIFRHPGVQIQAGTLSSHNKRRHRHCFLRRHRKIGEDNNARECYRCLSVFLKKVFKHNQAPFLICR